MTAARKRCLAGSPAALEIIGRVLHDRRQHVLARRREAAVMQRRHGDLEHRLRRAFAVLGRVEGLLDVLQVRRNEQPFAELRGFDAAKLRRAAERQMELCGVAGGAQVLHASRKFGFQVSRAEQLQQRRAWIGVRDHALGRNLRALLAAARRRPGHP